MHFFGLGDAEFGLGDTVNLWRDASGLSPHPLNLTFFICGLAFGLWVYVWSRVYIKQGETNEDVRDRATQTLSNGCARH